MTHFASIDIMLMYMVMMLLLLMPLTLMMKCLMEPYAQVNNLERVFFFKKNLTISKGQLISKCPFGVFKSPKKCTNFFPGFLP